MAPITDYDPVTGLPRRQGQQPFSYAPPPFSYAPSPGSGAGAPSLAFNATASAPGGTGFGATTGAPGTTAGGVNYGAYRDIIQSDPFYRQTLADLGAQGFADDASARAAAQSGLIRFGEVPANLEPSQAGWVDDTTRRLAEQNTAAGLSTTARLAKQQRDAVRAIRNVLAARGGLRSGELGYQLGEEQQRFATANYDARTQLMDYLAGINQGIVRAQRERQAAAAAAAAAAAGRGVQSGAGPGGQGGTGGDTGGGDTGGGDTGGTQPPAEPPPYNPYDYPSSNEDVFMRALRNRRPVPPPITNAGYYRGFVR
jgi:hypothetical protein